MKHLNHLYSFMILSTTITFMGCVNRAEDASCRTSDECYPGELCRFERCVFVSREDGSSERPGYEVEPDRGQEPLPPGAMTPAPRDEPPSSLQDMGGDTSSSPHTEAQDMGSGMSAERPWPDMETHHGVGSADMGGAPRDEEMGVARCEGLSPTAGELVINEVLMNVPTGEAGDANADGVRDAYDDEFLELVNVSEERLDLEGIEVLNGEKVKHTFLSLCLAPREAVVLFSGPKGRGVIARDGVIFMGADTRLGFSNSAGGISLRHPSGRTLFSFSYEQSRQASYVLWPELTGAQLVPHDTLLEALFSPGRCVDGQALSTGCANPVLPMSP